MPPMERAQHEPFYIATWRVEPSLNRVSQEGEVQQLDPRTMQVLLCLAAEPGAVVTREALMDRVWGAVIVSENTLSSVIARLRKILGDDWQHPQYIETISKSGYRLIAPVRAVPQPQGDHLPVLTLSPGVEIPARPASPVPPQASAWRLPAVLGGILLLALLGSGLWWASRPTARPLLDPQPLLTLPGAQLAATLSPDGAQVAFMWQGPSQDNWDVYLMLVGDANPVRVTTDPAPEGLPVWSPDGQYLAFVRGDPLAQRCDIFRRPVIGGPDVRLGDCGQGVNAMAWSPDGRYLATSSVVAPQTPPVLLLVDIEQQTQRALTQPADGSRGDRDPTFSPDGKQVAFRRRAKAGGYDVFLVPTAGGTPVQRTFDPQGTVSGLDWTPDGRHLLFASNRDGEHRLWRLPAEGGTPTRVALNDVGLNWLRHAREAERLVYRAVRDETDLWSLPLGADRSAPTPPAKVLSSTREELYPQFSPTGERVAFTSKRSGFYEVWTGNLDGTDLRRHTDFQGAQVGPARWSPDGASLVFDASPEGHADLYLVGADGTFPRRLTRDPFDEVQARFSRDGRWIYYSSNRTGRWEIWRMDAAGQAAEQVTRQSGRIAQEGHDAQALYFTRADTVGLWKIELPPRRPATLVLPDLRAQDWGNWVVVPDGIYYAQQGTQALAFYAFATRTTTEIFTPARTVSFIGPALTLSPDERTLLFGQIERSDDEVMLVDFAQ